MEYVNGPSLEKLLSDGKLPEKEVLLNFLRQIASALDYAHKFGIVHRDVKPSNLLVHFEHATGEQIAKVTDFGVAKFISQQMTQAGSMMGTPNYMAPEQIEGAEITGRTDQFALAAVAYEVLCGEKPFVADYIPTLFFRIVREDPKAADLVNPSLSPAINRTLQKGLAKSPSNRFESCTAFHQCSVGGSRFTPGMGSPYRMEPVVVAPPAEAETERDSAAPSSSAAFGIINDEPSRTLPLGQPQAAVGDPHAYVIYPPDQPDTAGEEPKPQGPVILPYDLPYRLPESRRGRNEDEKPEGLPLWRKVAIAVLICAMIAIGFAVYRNFTGNGAAAQESAPVAAGSAATPATEPNALGNAQSTPASPINPGGGASAQPSTQSSSAPAAPTAGVPTQTKRAAHPRKDLRQIKLCVTLRLKAEPRTRCASSISHQAWPCRFNSAANLRARM